MKGRFQWRTSVTVRAIRSRVWAIIDDISLIPQYHLEVRKVDLLSGQSTRAIGVKYRCTIPEGRKGSCIEEVVGYVPGERMATAFPEDTWGISKMFANFVVETVLIPHGERCALSKALSGSLKARKQHTLGGRATQHGMQRTPLNSAVTLTFIRGN